jgi:hypothetical protein
VNPTPETGRETSLNPRCCSRDTWLKQNTTRSAAIVETSTQMPRFQRIGNRVRAAMRTASTWVTSVKAALLSLAMLCALVVCGIGIYSADASNNHYAVDGYGVVAAR